MLRGVSRLFLGLLGSLCLWISVSFAQTELDRVQVMAGQDTPRPTEAPEEIEKRTKARTGLVSFNRYESDLVELCHALYYDGRVEAYVTIAERLSGFDPNCGSCRPFFKAIIGTCEKAARAREKANARVYATATAIEERPVEEGTPVPVVPTIEVPVVVPERDPSNDALNVVSRIFTTMAENEKDLPEAIIALQKFVSGLSAAEPQRSESEREYFDTLTTYIMSPFEEYLAARAAEEAERRRGRGEGEKKNVEESGENVDSMFE